MKILKTFSPWASFNKMRRRNAVLGALSVPVLMLLVLFSFVLSANIAKAAGAEIQITDTENNYFPSIYGDKIVYQSDRTRGLGLFNDDIYVYNISTSKETQITTIGSNSHASINGDKLVYMSDRSMWYQVYMYDLSTSKETHVGSAAPYVNVYPSIFGDTIAYPSWLSFGISTCQISTYTISTSQTTQITNDIEDVSSGSYSYSDNRYPTAYGNKIVFTDDNGELGGIRMYDISTSQITKLFLNPKKIYKFPTISDNKLVYSAEDTVNGFLGRYVYDFSTGKEINIPSDAQTTISNNIIYGNKIVYSSDRSGNSEVYMYDLSTLKETQITTIGSNSNASIYGDKIVYSSNRSGNSEVYMYTLTDLPVPNFSSIPTSGFAPLNVKFTDTSVNAEDCTYSWNFGDGNSSGEKNPTNTFNKAGDYTVTLTVSNTEVSNSYSQEIHVKNLDFDVNPTKVRISDNVEFDANKYLGVLNGDFTWDFGDGTNTDISGNSIVKHKFTEPGSYTVNLIVKDSMGAERKVSKTVNVTIPVVLVHGFMSSSDIWQGMTAELIKNGYDKDEVWNFDYQDSNIDDPRTISPKLANKITEWRNDLSYNGQKYTGQIDIICHSMGAIISRLYMEKDDGGIHGKEVRQWIGIAPAQGGSALADLGTSVLDSSTPLSLLSWIYCPALDQLKTTSASVTSLGPLSPTTKYWVIDGWNPTHDPNFGEGLSATRAKDKSGNYYWTYNGDMAVSIEQSYRDNMEFEAFPSSNADLGGSPASEFDHLHIHSSPRVIAYVVDCLKNIDKHSSKNKPPEEIIPFFTFAANKIGGLLGTTTQKIDVPFSDLIPIGSNNGPAPLQVKAGTMANILAVFDSEENKVYSVVLDWDAGDVAITLVSPSGIEYKADSHPNNILYTKEGNSLSFIISNPEIGNWSVNLMSTNYPGHDINYNLTYFIRDISNSEPVVTPVVSFTSNITSGTSPLNVSFMDSSTNASGCTYSWDFGDGSAVSTEKNPSHTFAAKGSYSVILTLTNGSKTYASAPITITVTDPIIKSAPIPDFTSDASSGYAPLKVTFKDQSTGATAWLWSFGDFTFSTSQNPVHTYDRAGKYTVILTAINKYGLRIKTKINYITVLAVPKPPKASFTAKPTSGKSPLNVKFTDNSSNTPTGWVWNFGDTTLKDGGTSQDQNPSHVYTAAGKYTVSLTVKNSAGQSVKTIKDYIVVRK